jgi:glucose/arabinose dehydrogenase
MMYRWLWILVLGVALRAATVPTDFTDTTVVAGLSSPTAFAFAPDGRIFVCQQGGALWVVQNNALLSTPFLTLSVNSSGERGLLGVAFDPDFATNQYVYVYYTTSVSPLRNRVSRFTANGNVAATGSEVVLVELENLTSATNHNGGAMHFGTDGKLYVAVGDNATPSNAQTLSNRLGKMLRINKDGSIPTDNPFYNTATGANRMIWALGLRNPYTFAVQRGTGRIFINDVGQNTWEEVNDGLAGANYGWPVHEGPSTNPLYVSPFYSYGHGGSSPSGCAITGGAFYNPVTVGFPATYVGRYFFADFCSGFIATLVPSTQAVAFFLTGADGIVDLRTNDDGSLYYLQRGGGELHRIAFTGIVAPSISVPPQSSTVPAGTTATFNVTAAGGGLSYQWQRNTVNIQGATGASYSLTATQGDDGAQFRVVVSNTAGSVTSAAATLTVTTNQAPTPTIQTPASGTLFSGGETILFGGGATDPETGALPGSALRWRVDYHTGNAVRPFVQEFTNASGGSFLVPTVTPYTLTDVFFRVHLTARDPFGNEASTFRDVGPRVSTITLASQPAGRTLTLDGQSLVAPAAVASVVGLQRELGLSSPQQVGNTRYVFGSWSNGQAAVHNIQVPAASATYTAMFGTQHLLTVNAAPVGGGTVSGGGWYAEGTNVGLTATPAAGWQLNGFTGASGASVLMNSPREVTANFAPLPGMLTMVVVGKVNGAGVDERVWSVRVSNAGQGPVVNARIGGLSIAPTGPGTVALLSTLPVALGTIPPGGSVVVPVSLRWPITVPTTRARFEFALVGDYGYASNVVMNSLFR